MSESQEEIKEVFCPVNHSFCDGIYARQIEMPKGAYVFGKKHKTNHFNFIMKGRALVYMDGVVSEISAPCVLVSNAETQKILYILDDMVWVTTHATNKTDIDILERNLVYEASIDKLLLEDALNKLHSFNTEGKECLLQ